MKKILYFLLVFVLFIGNKLFVFGAFNEEVCKINVIKDAGNIVFSSDGKSYAYTVKIDGKYQVIKDGKTVGKDYNSFSGKTSIPEIKYSFTGSNYSYKAFIDNKAVLIKDGEKISKDSEFVISFDYIPFSKDIVYIYANNTDIADKFSGIRESFSNIKQFIYIKGTTFSGYDISDPVFSLDGKHYYFLYSEENDVNQIIKTNGESINQKQHIVYDGKDLGISYDPTFSNDGKNFAYVKIKDGKSFVIKNDVDNLVGYLSIKGMYYSSGGLNLAYIIKENSKENVVINNIKGDSYDNIDELSFVFSPDGKSYMYYAFDNNKDTGSGYLIKDSLILQEGTDLKNVKIGYLNNGLNYYYSYGTGGIFHLIKDGIELGLGYQSSYVLYKDEKNSNFAYALEENSEKTYVNANGTRAPNGYSNISNFNYTSDGKSFSYIGFNSGKPVYIIDNIETSTGYVNINNFAYSIDGKNTFFKGSKDSTQAFYYVKDFKEIGTGSSINDKYEYNFSPDGKIIFSNSYFKDGSTNLTMIVCKNRFYYVFDTINFIKYNWWYLIFVVIVGVIFYILRILYIIRKYNL